MSQPASPPPSPPSAAGSVAGDAAKIAGGSAVVMAGGVGERGLRLVLNWVLARFLGPEAFGVYSFVQTMVTTLVSLSALGTDGGVVFFGARYRKAGEQGRLKGTLGSCLAIGLLAGLIFTAGLWLLGRTWTVGAERQAAVSALTIGALSVLFGTVQAVLVGGLVAAKDMRGQALVGQLGLPALTLATAGLALAMDMGVDGALWAMAVAYGLSMVHGAHLFWRRFGPLLRDRAIPAQTEIGALLRYSIPQSLARSLYQANMRIDILMLTAMATLSDVGVYKIATMIAQLGALPVMASTTMFGPVVSELVYAREQARLNALLRVVTRWMIILSAPAYIVLVLVPDLVLTVFDPAYAAGGRALAVLMLGQAVYVASAPSGALVTMGGNSGTNLVNGLLSVGLNVGLNALLIPRMGMEGAALASAVALTLWSTLRVLEARWLQGCWAFDRRVAWVLSAALVSGAAAAALGQGAALLPRLGLAGAAVAVFLVAVALAGRTEEDELVLGRVRAKLRRGRS